MSYNKRPYFLFPPIPNLMRRYEVASGSTYLRSFPRNSIEVRLDETAQITVNHGKLPLSLIKALIKMGDVTITTSADSHVFKNIHFPEHFHDAVNNEINKPAIAARNAEAVRNAEYEDFIVAIPQVPAQIDNLVYRLQYLSQKSIPHKKEGDYVEQGVHIVTSCGVNIAMPFDGKIESIGSLSSIEHWLDNADWPQEHTGEHIQKSDTNSTYLLYLRPVKGSDISGAIAKAYSPALSYLEGALDSKKFRNSMLNGQSSDANDPAFSELRRIMNKVRTAPTKTLNAPTDVTIQPSPEL